MMLKRQLSSGALLGLSLMMTTRRVKKPNQANPRRRFRALHGRPQEMIGTVDSIDIDACVLMETLNPSGEEQR